MRSKNKDLQTVRKGLVTEYVPPARGALVGRYGVPPFSVLNGRDYDWIVCKRRWLKWLNIKSDEGRGDTKESRIYDRTHNFFNEKYGRTAISFVSVFDPVLCELIYRWWGPEKGGMVFDPFCGGSVRGIVASMMDLNYYGIDIRPDQIKANEANWENGPCPKLDVPRPEWVVGDSLKASKKAPECDLLFSCPPYGNIEVYSKLDGDISRLVYEEFEVVHRAIVKRVVRRLKPGGFAVWVVAPFYDRKFKKCRDFVGDSIRAFEEAGCVYHTDAVYCTPVGTACLRTSSIFDRGNKKLVRSHQNVLVFRKDQE